MHGRVRKVVVDVETTGKDPETDLIIELALVPFDFCPASGRIFKVGTPLVSLEVPGIPIPEEIVALTGITDYDVAEKKIDDVAVESFIEDCVLIIAHNARFDRRFLNSRLPAFREKHWACSIDDVPWASGGSKARGLECLLADRCGMFHDAHRAENDCYAVLHLLATSRGTDRLPMLMLLESARCRSARIWAQGAPFATKKALRKRGYHWNDGEDGNPKAWVRDVREPAHVAEVEWLYQNVYEGTRPELPVHWFTAKKRYSE